MYNILSRLGKKLKYANKTKFYLQQVYSGEWITEDIEAMAASEEWIRPATVLKLAVGCIMCMYDWSQVSCTVSGKNTIDRVVRELSILELTSVHIKIHLCSKYPFHSAALHWIPLQQYPLFQPPVSKNTHLTVTIFQHLTFSKYMDFLLPLSEHMN